MDAKKKAMLLVMEPEKMPGYSRPEGKEALLVCPRCGFEGEKERFKESHNSDDDEY